MTVLYGIQIVVREHHSDQVSNHSLVSLCSVFILISRAKPKGPEILMISHKGALFYSRAILMLLVSIYIPQRLLYRNSSDFPLLLQT